MGAHSDNSLVVVGAITAVHGVRGWVKVKSYTRPPGNILQYQPWLIRLEGEWHEVRLDDSRTQANGIIARLQGYDDRDQAQLLIGAEVATHREQLPPIDRQHYYWADLVGLEVISRDGHPLGTVDHLIETGAHDVLVVEGERQRLIPFVPGAVVVDVDLHGGVLTVDWEPDY